MSQIWKSYFFVILAALGYSATAIFVKLSYLGGMLPLPLVSLRIFLAAWLMFFYLLMTRKIRVSEIPSSLIILGIPGFLGFGGAAIGFLMSLKYLSAPIASILLYTYPTIVTILSAFIFKEPFSKRRLVALLLTFCGILFVINVFNSKDFELHTAGILYSLLAAFSYAFFNIYGQKNIANTSPLLLTFYPLAAGAIILPLFANPLYFINTPHITVNFLFGLALAVLCTVLPMILYFKGLEKVKASTAAIIASFEPVFTGILAALILGDVISTMQIIGGVFILIGVLVLQTEGK